MGGVGCGWEGLFRDDRVVSEMMLNVCKKLTDEIESARRAVVDEEGKVKQEEEQEEGDGGRGASERAARIGCLSVYMAEVLDVIDARHVCDMAMLAEAEAEIETLGERSASAQVELASARGLLAEDGKRPEGIDLGSLESRIHRLEWQDASKGCEQGLGAARRRLNLLFSRCSAWMSRGSKVLQGEQGRGADVSADGISQAGRGHDASEAWSSEGILLSEELAMTMNRITAETAKSMEACKAASIVVQTRARADGSSSLSWAEVASDGRSALDEDLSRRRF